MEKIDIFPDNILVVSVMPYFIEKGVLWFQENLGKILEARKTQNFFEDNMLFLEKGRDYNFSQILRKLDEMGYEKVFSISEPGEFAQRGGVIDIFPINSISGARIDFLGNILENIKMLPIKITDEKKSQNILKNKIKSQKFFSDLTNLKQGDFIVHLDHGVARFCGIEKFQTEYYILEYDQEDKLYVPLGLERKLSRYVGFTDPKVSRLGSGLWQKTKKQIKENVEKLAKELLDLYAQKEVVRRPAYSQDKEMEDELKSGFSFQETPDQAQAINDIKDDLSKTSPMDRLVCGDVGFGKTEIAIRASGLTVANNGQVAVICPTTILADQHFNNFKKRFAKLPIRVSFLSRLQNQTEQEKIIKDTKEGKIDILIGTHRILSNDVQFKNLMMLIIDDEQKFGVKQKEKLRKIRTDIDVLLLSATPIPRTIYLAMSSLKNISLIQTPPQGRISVKNFFLPFDEKIIKKAIYEEIKRNGQVFYLHNKVQTIEKTKHNLQELLPRAKIGFAHGKMSEKKLVQIMDDFQKEKLNVLVATTIIENGIDMPKVNTIIIEDATKLGLSQAYQIRGRVGRSFAQGFAYFFYENKNLTALARQRLDALKEAEEIGSGYRIAIKDLEIRGAGNILGKEQSGSINKIGLNLYCQVLSEAIEKMRS